MPRLCLLADDLTGALDSAARFVAACGPVPVSWRGGFAEGARDLATREGSEAAAVAAHAACGPALRRAGLAFKKLDSLLRGHVAAEIAASWRAGSFDHAVIAPAFPFQGRITHGGRQFAHGAAVGPDLAAALAQHGVAVIQCRPGMAAPLGVSLWDAATDADLAVIAAAGRALPGRVLWCGTGGLAGTLAGGDVPCPVLPEPVLALIGSEHAVSRGQLAATARHLVLAEDERAVPSLPAAVSLALPPGLAREAAAERIARAFVALARRVARPGSLAVAGGETLRGLCDGLGATGLVVLGEMEPGAAISRMEGGLWHGLPILSKSGAFGAPDFLARLLGG